MVYVLKRHFPMLKFGIAFLLNETYHKTNPVYTTFQVYYIFLWDFWVVVIEIWGRDAWLSPIGHNQLGVISVVTSLLLAVTIGIF